MNEGFCDFVGGQGLRRNSIFCPAFPFTLAALSPRSPQQVVDWNMDRECLDVVEAAYAFARIEASGAEGRKAKPCEGCMHARLPSPHRRRPDPQGLQQGHYDFIQCYVQRAFAYLGLERGVCSQADVNAVVRLASAFPHHCARLASILQKHCGPPQFMYNPELEVAWFDCHMNDFLSWSAFQKTSQERRPEDSLLNAKSNRSEGSGLDSVDQEAAAPEDEAAAVKAEEGGAGAEGASDHDAGADE